MDDYRLLIDLHKHASRQGPGGDAESEKALDLAMVDRAAPLKIADIGCGTGASTLLLARLLNARITAVDFLQDFLDILERRADRLGLSENITPLCRSMDAKSRRRLLVDALQSQCHDIAPLIWGLALLYQPQDDELIRAALGHERRRVRVKGALTALGLRTGAAQGKLP